MGPELSKKIVIITLMPNCLKKQAVIIWLRQSLNSSSKDFAHSPVSSKLNVLQYVTGLKFKI
jgi:hypothetical protein